MKLRITVLCLAVRSRPAAVRSPSEQAVRVRGSRAGGQSREAGRRTPGRTPDPKAYTRHKAAVRTSPTLAEGTCLKGSTTTALSTASAKAGEHQPRT